MTRQAIQLGYCPRLNIHHTSESEIGQVYIPWINWTLLLRVIALIIGFGSSDNLANAYGVAITGMMTIDTILVFFVVTTLWKWPSWLVLPLFGCFLIVDLALFSANTIKLVFGGWFPIVLALFVFTCFATWHRGRTILNRRLAPSDINLTSFLDSILQHPPIRVPGTAVFLTSSSGGVPPALLHNLNHNKVLHENVILLTVKTADIPHIAQNDCLNVENLRSGFRRVSIIYGFKDTPNIPRDLSLGEKGDLPVDTMKTSYFLSRQTLVPKFGDGMILWREQLFTVMSRNSGSATAFFQIPANRVIELGTRIEF